ncbi:hypothetical protein Tco_0124268, partial [Tanacetum coccineum]
MGNETFINNYSQAYAIFLPYLMSDHCPVVLVLPNTVQAKKKSFRFANFVTDKEEFGDIVKRHWASVEEGCNMFKVVKNLKLLKRHLKALAWKNGDIFEKVKDLRDRLKEIQIKLDKDPSEKILREEEKSIPVRKIIGIEELFKVKLSVNDAMSTIHDVSDAEIKRVMFQIDDNKAPGRDGFSS